MGPDYRYCQPDALISRYDLLYIFEIKYSHTTDAWWQLEHLYSPVLAHLYPEKRQVLVNVVRSANPDIRFPGEAPWPLLFSFDALISQPSKTAILQWRP